MKNGVETPKKKDKGEGKKVSNGEGCGNPNVVIINFEKGKTCQRSRREEG